MKNNILYLVYDYNTDLFVSMFCENKDRPQMNCDGKCQLAKIQKEERKKDAENTLKQLEHFFYNNAKVLALDSQAINFSEHYSKTPFSPQHYSFSPILRLIKPPSIRG